MMVPATQKLIHVYNNQNMAHRMSETYRQTNAPKMVSVFETLYKYRGQSWQVCGIMFIVCTVSVGFENVMSLTHLLKFMLLQITAWFVYENFNKTATDTWLNRLIKVKSVKVITFRQNSLWSLPVWECSDYLTTPRKIYNGRNCTVTGWL